MGTDHGRHAAPPARTGPGSLALSSTVPEDHAVGVKDGATLFGDTFELRRLFSSQVRSTWWGGGGEAEWHS